MPTGYSPEICINLEQKAAGLLLHRPIRVTRYEPGTELAYNITEPATAAEAGIRLSIERFVGGGFAGQVYKVRILTIETQNANIDSLHPGQICAMKILTPPSTFARFFRNLLYKIGFQGPFQLQVNPHAATAAALWQKFIRRAAKIRLGSESAVADVYATFIDHTIGSCGELIEWIEGRTWRLEVDDHMDLLKLWKRRKVTDSASLGSPEYRAKKKFMADLVNLLHEIGAPELARQYEWSTCKSQPNCLKRYGSDSDPAAGLVAVDFKAGLTLLLFLPMSPGDFKLIAKGLCRGSLVQFDRGNLTKLQSFIAAHADEFADMTEALERLRQAEENYRNSVPDITHNHLRLFYSKKLWKTILDSAVTGFKVRNLIDDNWEKKLRQNKLLTLLFALLGLIPFLGRLIRQLWARPDWRKHYRSMLSSIDYSFCAFTGRVIEKTIDWHRKGRISAARAQLFQKRPARFLAHLPLAILPAPLHRFLTDSQFRKEKLHYIFVRPFKLYFNSDLREQWLRDMVAEGKTKHILTNEDARTILSHLSEPYVQRYLISLVVHLLTLPITQIVSVLIAAIYILTHPEMPRAQAWGIALGIIAAFQIVPISPGSLCRGLWAVGIAVHDRSFKNYNIAVFLSFFKYVGYLAFPIQMAYHYPALSRFMAAHWATEAVHFVPVFGERGALLEHWVFRLFYNWPLTIRRRMANRTEMRKSLKPRYWHIPLIALAATAVLAVADVVFFRHFHRLPTLWDIWPVTLLTPALCGTVITIAAGGTPRWKRILTAAACGTAISALHALFLSTRAYVVQITAFEIATRFFWTAFAFAVLSAIAACLTELSLPDPRLTKRP